MAKPYFEINKTQFKEQYNLVAILIDKIEIMKQLQTFNPKNQAVAFATKKKSGSNAPEWFLEFAEKQEKFNQMVIDQFKAHG
ncbi:MAG: hypothetical protein MJ233_03845 [Mycoplasmoidaceae bacterium]|nr:hypothetical protein [Mycoplasmoidaceae bacterium]